MNNNINNILEKEVINYNNINGKNKRKVEIVLCDKEGKPTILFEDSEVNTYRDIEHLEDKWHKACDTYQKLISVSDSSLKMTIVEYMDDGTKFNALGINQSIKSLSLKDVNL